MSEISPARPLSETLPLAHRVIITITVMAATMMEVLDTSIVNVALPNMQGELGATLDEISWVSTGYIIANVIVLPLTGWLSDYFGRRLYLFYSVILFTLASLGCGIGASLSQLILFRILQGAGGAAFLSTAQATLLEIFPKKRHGQAQALFGMGVIMAPTLGPTLGGYLVDHFSWPWIFYINVPVGIAAAFLIHSYVPDSLVAGARRAPDVMGIVYLAIGLSCLQTILERGERDDWFQAGYICALAVIAVIGLGLFLRWELSPDNPSPAIDLRVLRNRNLAAGCFCGFALGFTLYGTILLLPQFWQVVQPHTAQQTGLLLLPGGLATALIMPGVGRFVGRYDARLLIGCGMAILGMAMFVTGGRLTVHSPDSAFFVPLVMRGLGIGCQFVPLSLTTLGTLPPRQIAQGAGLYNLFRQLGGSFGIALLATLLSRRQKFHYDRLVEHLQVTDPQVQAHMAGLRRAMHGLGLDPAAADVGALKSLYGSVMRESMNLSFIDCFVVLGCASFGSMAFLLLFERGRNRNAAAAAH